MSAWAWIVAGVGWAAGAWLLARIPALRASPARPFPSVSVVVPARDEQGSLPHLLRSVHAQDPPPAEVVVVDDGSADGTAARAAEGGATVVAAPPLAAGWVGKTAACAAGARATRGEVLVFVDADVVLAPGALGAVVGELGGRGGLVSVQPFHRTRRPYERLSAVGNLVSMMGSLAFTGPPARPATMAFGPCLATSRADYELVGGHAHPSVRGQVAEDIALARSYRRHARPVSAFGGHRAVSFRMYPDGVDQLVDGWTRSLVAGARRVSVFGLVGPFVWVAGALVASWDGVRAVAGGADRSVHAIVYVAWAGEVAWMLRRVGRFGALTSALFPVPVLAFVALCGRSALRHAMGRPVPWRGRLVKPH